MTEAVIVATARSPIGRAGKGSLVDVRPDDLTAQVIRAALAKVPPVLDDPTMIDDLYLGCGLPGGEQGFNMARVVAVELGFVNGSSDSWPGTHNPIFAGAEARTAQAAGGGTTWFDPRHENTLPDIYIPMGQTAENLAQVKGVSREDMDHFGVRSQNLAEKAIRDGFWQREITPVTRPDGSEVSADDGPRAGVTYEAVSQLKPVFRPDGRITAGNCCPLNDGAAAVVIMSDRKAAQLGLTPLARIVSTGVSALSPEIMGLGPVEASTRALRHANMTIGDIDLVEINEAFAAQVIPSYGDLGVDIDKLNVNGGAIAVGHPFGMTGARITTTLVNSLSWHDKQFGLETMCVGGGQGMAMIIERMA
jgi:acetyl-CoA C-acetyltransferase